MDLLQLKSGTDIRGTVLVNEGQPPLNVLAVKSLAKAFIRYFNLKKVSVGHDSRLTANMLSDAAVQGIMDEGSDVLFCGLCSTPSMFMTTKLNDCDGAIMLTASHHPKDKNGMKFFTKDGGVSSKQLSEIIEIAQKIYDGQEVNSKKLQKSQVLAKYYEDDYLADYCEHLKKIFVSNLGEMPLKGLKIAVDAGNGSAGFFATRILEPLGADISGSQFLEPDGNFPNHSPNPEDKEAMASICKRVVETGSDLGVIFDTDGDRSAIVDSDGMPLNRNRLIAVISDIILREQKGACIVTDSVTSEGLKEFILSRGGEHIRYKRGYQNVISFAKQLCEQGKNAPLAIETSGHAAIKENYFLDDGAYLAAKLIIEAVRLKKEGKTISDLIKDLKEPVEEKSYRINLVKDTWKQDGEKALNVLTELGKKYRLADDSYEGVRIYTEDGWFMARMSVHDPVIPINIEADIKGGVSRMTNIIYNAIKDIDGLDLTPLKAIIN